MDRIKQCPVAEGRYGEDFGIFLECDRCPVKENCESAFKKRQAEFAKNLKGPRWLTIPAGLLSDASLTPLERELIALIAFRSQKGGHAYDKNANIGTYLGVTPNRISQLLSPSNPNSLVSRGYLVAAYQTLKRRGKKQQGRPYRTSRKVGLGLRAVRLLNLTSESPYLPHDPKPMDKTIHEGASER